MEAGKWLKVRAKTGAFSYWHHGVTASTDSVVHFWRGKLRETSLDTFKATGEDAQVVDDEPDYEPDEVAERARTLIGLSADRLPTRNPERFAYWCCRGPADAIPGSTDSGWTGLVVAGVLIMLFMDPMMRRL